MQELGNVQQNNQAAFELTHSGDIAGFTVGKDGTGRFNFGGRNFQDFRSGVDDQSDQFAVKLVVRTDDRPGLLNQLTSILSTENTNIRSLEARSDAEHGDGAIIEMTVDVRDKKQLEKLVVAMRRISGVRDVERLLN